jgi:hypothetical protein
MRAKRMNEVFSSLAGRQRSAALVHERSRLKSASHTVRLSGQKKGLPGIRFGELSRDQRDLVRKVMSDVLRPFRAVDARNPCDWRNSRVWRISTSLTSSYRTSEVTAFGTSGRSDG